MNTIPGKTQRKPLIITRRDEEILRAIYQYRYMTALDVAWLFFKPSSHTHVREILSSLAGGQDLGKHTYLCRFGLPSVGNAERVFTLGAKGRRFLAQECGLPINWSFRPHKLKYLSVSHVLHSLILTRVAVAAQVWSRRQSAFTLQTVRLSYDLADAPVRAARGKPKPAAVIPDAWLLWERVSNGNHVPIMIEIDRGMEYQQRFKQHVRSRIKYLADGSYTRTFGSQSATIAYVTTGQTPEYRDTRRETMRRWALEACADLGMEQWARLFRFTSTVYKDLYDLTLFEQPVWYPPHAALPVPLIAPEPRPRRMRAQTGGY